MVDDNTIEIKVEPKLFPISHFFSNVNDEFNAVILETYPNDELMFIGKGAGSLPTASAIVNDIYLIYNNKALETYKNINKYNIK